MFKILLFLFITIKQLCLLHIKERREGLEYWVPVAFTSTTVVQTTEAEEEESIKSQLKNEAGINYENDESDP